MNNEIVLEAKNMRKVYNFNSANAFEALHDINFQVKKGEFVGIMGPSGSGKSTFLNNISTLDRPTDGKVYINGKLIHAMSSNEVGKFRYEHLGFIFQNFNLLKAHTMYENIAMPLSLAHVAPEEIRERVTAIAKDLNIDTLLNKLPSECSGGQRQRAAIARALINNPDLIIADEPTGNLDSVNGKALLKTLQMLNRDKGVTIVMVSHDPMIVSYTTRLVYLRDGSIETVLEKGDMTQKQYFHKIMEVSQNESEEFFTL